MGMMTTALLAISAFQGVSQIASGMYEEREASANAELQEANAARLEAQAGVVDVMKNIKAMQDDRMINIAASKTVAATASKGIEMSGSPAAILVNTRTQMEIDKAISQYNYEVEKSRYMTDASITRIGARGIRAGGRAARAAGIGRGLTTFGSALMLSGAEGSFDTNKKYVTIGGKKTLVAPDDYYLSKAARLP